MRKYQLVFDGSTCDTTKQLGVGVVDYTDGEIVTIISCEVSKAHFTGCRKSLIAEGLAACEALEYAEPDSDIEIFGDNTDIIRLLNGGAPHQKELQLKHHIDGFLKMHRTVIATHIGDTNKKNIPEEIFAAAHNASAIASGSKKREPTGSYAVGQFSAAQSTLGQQADGMAIVDDYSGESYPDTDPRSYKPQSKKL